MAYTINLTNGTLLTTVADGTINDSSCSMTLIGRNYSGYGTFFNENLVHLLENFANVSPPNTPLNGQLWWDASGNIRVWNGTDFRNLGTITSSNTAPSNSKTGHFWWDTSNQQLKLYNGSSFTLIGPDFTSNTGVTGVLVGNITDTTFGQHVAVNVWVNNTLVGIYSKDQEYTPQTGITGFTSVKPGFNLVSTGTVANVAMYGTASNASDLQGVSGTNYARKDIAAVFGSSVTSNVSVIVGTSSNLVANLNTIHARLTNTQNLGNLTLRVTVSGVGTDSININGANGQVELLNNTSVVGSLTVSGNITGQNVLGTVIGNIATTSNIVTTANVIGSYFVGIATEAQYADIAERFSADSFYQPGTVVRLGGINEITQENENLSGDVLGVISTQAAYLMNAGAGSNQTHPQVALHGRVPVRVIGKVKKGDRLVSAGNGLAKAAKKQEITPYNIIGRSLEDKSSLEEGLVLAIVKLNS